MVFLATFHPVWPIVLSPPGRLTPVNMVKADELMSSYASCVVPPGPTSWIRMLSLKPLLMYSVHSSLTKLKSMVMGRLVTPGATTNDCSSVVCTCASDGPELATPMRFRCFGAIGPSDVTESAVPVLVHPFTPS